MKSNKHFENIYIPEVASYGLIWTREMRYISKARNWAGQVMGGQGGGQFEAS